ncbi:MAG: PCP reductase family protein [Hyphomicrobiales bacterium]|nr:PCP reductase family protein [Hyphomicrobiales bacterium]
MTIDHVQPFLGTQADVPPTWGAAALARLSRLPEMAREAVRRRAEAHAREAGEAEVTLHAVEAALADSRKVMEQVMHAGGHKLRPQQGE